ncbi:MAG: YihY/virulence factor BrkB family protein [Bacteroidetes bacterium]|nr:YihY/virulence factor BrkB family protein [Bacteroidota bacterium]
MLNLITIIKNAWVFVSKTMWGIRLNKLDPRKGFLVKQLRILSLAVQGFNEDKCLTKASALTYYTLFSIVPVLALVFAIAKGFGFDANLKAQLSAKYSEYGSILSNAFIYADSLLATTKGGIIAGFGIVLLLWSVLKLLMNIEASFNEIWEIKRGRTWVRKITDYLTIMLVSPLFLIIAGGLTVAIQTKLGSIVYLGVVTKILIQLLAFIILALVFCMLYMVLPNTKVNFKAAASAGIISTVLFNFLNWAYVKFQIGASNFNAIYGGFAALPLFLIWVQYSWYVVLFGAEIAFANQNVDHYELDHEIMNLSDRYKKAIGLMIANMVAKRFYDGAPLLTVSQIATELDLPMRLARTIVNEFVETKVFVEVRTEIEKEYTYQPAVTESKFTVKYIFDALDLKGVNNLLIEDKFAINKINDLLSRLDLENEKHLGKILVKDVV